MKILRKGLVQIFFRRFYLGLVRSTVKSNLRRCTTPSFLAAINLYDNPEAVKIKLGELPDICFITQGFA
jgi:hypothetical protein